MSHALVVGGTGMLRPVSLYLAKIFDVVSVIAQSNRLDDLVKEANRAGRVINPIKVDYHDPKELENVLKETVGALGAIDIAVVWIHMKKAPEAAYVVAKYVQGRYVHLLPSWTAEPTAANQIAQTERRMRFEAMKNIKPYQEVVLGWQPTTPARWLTSELIANGTLYVLERPALLRYVVGTVEPWDARPAR